MTRPAYAPQHETLVDGDLVTFEVDYDDGTQLLQRNLPTSTDAYAEIDRGRLRAFKLVDPGGILIELKPPEGATGHNLIYRKRTQNDVVTVPGPDGPRIEVKRHVVFLIGWAPMGPAILIAPAVGKYRVEQGFIVGDPDMYPPDLYPGDGQFLMDNFATAK